MRKKIRKEKKMNPSISYLPRPVLNVAVTQYQCLFKEK